MCSVFAKERSAAVLQLAAGAAVTETPSASSSVELKSVKHQIIEPVRSLSSYRAAKARTLDVRIRRGRRQRSTFAVTCLAWLSFTKPAGAADQAGSSVLVYVDSDNATVWKPLGSTEMTWGPATVRAQWSTDFISAASVDLVSAASPKGFSERRHQADLGASWDLGDGASLGLVTTVSREPDFRSQSLTLAGSRGWWDRRLTTAVSIGLATAATGRVLDDTAWRDRTSQDGQLLVSLVLSPVTVVDTLYNVARLDGFQASPYRYVRLFRDAAALHETAIVENTPTERWRHAWTGRLRHRLRVDLFGQTDYRLYVDSWGMVAHTASARAVWTLPAEAWTVTLEGRGHRQSGVAFYQGRYQTLPLAPVWRTADKELGPMWTALGGVHLEWSRRLFNLSVVRVGAGADLLHMRYADHPYLRERTAVLTTVGIEWQH